MPLETSLESLLERFFLRKKPPFVFPTDHGCKLITPHEAEYGMEGMEAVEAVLSLVIACLARHTNHLLFGPCREKKDGFLFMQITVTTSEILPVVLSPAARNLTCTSPSDCVEPFSCIDFGSWDTAPWYQSPPILVTSTPSGNRTI